MLSHWYVVLHSELRLRGKSGLVYPTYIAEAFGVGDLAEKLSNIPRDMKSLSPFSFGLL